MEKNGIRWSIALFLFGLAFRAAPRTAEGVEWKLRVAQASERVFEKHNDRRTKRVSEA